MSTGFQFGSTKAGIATLSGGEQAWGEDNGFGDGHRPRARRGARNGRPAGRLGHRASDRPGALVVCEGNEVDVRRYPVQERFEIPRPAPREATQRSSKAARPDAAASVRPLFEGFRLRPQQSLRRTPPTTTQVWRADATATTCASSDCSNERRHYTVDTPRSRAQKSERMQEVGRGHASGRDVPRK